MQMVTSIQLQYNPSGRVFILNFVRVVYYMPVNGCTRETTYFILN